IPEMRRVVHGGSARVHQHGGSVGRSERLHLPRHRVVQAELAHAAPTPSDMRASWNARIASINATESYRTGSVAGSPVSREAVSMAARASASLRSNVFSETPITGEGRSGASTSSCIRIRSASGGIVTQGLFVISVRDGWPHI